MCARQWLLRPRWLELSDLLLEPTSYAFGLATSVDIMNEMACIRTALRHDTEQVLIKAAGAYDEELVTPSEEAPQRLSMGLGTAERLLPQGSSQMRVGKSVELGERSVI